MAGDFGWLDSILGGDSSQPNQPSAPNTAATATAVVPDVVGNPSAMPNAIKMPDIGLREPKNPDEAFHQTATLDIEKTRARVGATPVITSIMQQAMDAQNSLVTDTVKNYDNLKTIERFPGGEKSGLIKILGMFDSDYSPGYQRTNIEENTVKAAAIAERAKTQAAIAVAIPDMYDLVAATSDKLGKDTQTLANFHLEQYKVHQDDLKIGIERQNAASQRMQALATVDRNQREATQFKIQSMHPADLNAAIQDANTNPKSPWRNLAGALQEEQYKQADVITNLHILKTSAAKGDMELADQAGVQIIRDTPIQAALALRAQAQKEGKGYITIGKGADAVNIPLDTVDKGIHTGLALENQTYADAATEEIDRQQLPQKAANLASTASSFANDIPGAGQILTNMHQSMQQVRNKPSLPAIKILGSMFDQNQARLASMAKDYAKQFSSKAAQDAVESVGSGRALSPEGAQAIAAETVGNWSATRKGSSIYPEAWGVYNQALAAQVAKSQIGMMGTGDSVMDGAAGVMALLNKGDPKIASLRLQVMNDDGNNKRAAAAVAGSIKQDAQIAALQELSKQKGASPVWHQLLTDSSIRKPEDIINRLEEQRVMAGGKVDYTNAYLNAIRGYGVNADAITASDPRKALRDRSLEIKLFGRAPHSAVVSDLYQQLRGVAADTRSKLTDAVRRDLAGQTTLDTGKGSVLGSIPGVMFGDTSGFSGAVPAAVEGLSAVPGALFGNVGDIGLKKGPNTAPSATGLPLTQHDIRTLYGGGN